MADRPILFSAPMVRALLDGRKTQTRRALKPAPFVDANGNFCAADKNGTLWNWGQHIDGRPCTRNYMAEHVRFAIGDRLWVRESGIELPGFPGGAGDLFRHDVPVTPKAGVYWSRANGGPGATYIVAGCSRASALAGKKNAKVRPSIHMPRWASRLTLTVTDVRVERLRDISKADVLAEGVFTLGQYATLWDSINGPGAWEANPWVVAVSFTVGRHNIDAEAL